jgi:hypothetical protein
MPIAATMLNRIQVFFMSQPPVLIVSRGGGFGMGRVSPSSDPGSGPNRPAEQNRTEQAETAPIPHGKERISQVPHLLFKPLSTQRHPRCLRRTTLPQGGKSTGMLSFPTRSRH